MVLIESRELSRVLWNYAWGTFVRKIFFLMMLSRAYFSCNNLDLSFNPSCHGSLCRRFDYTLNQVLVASPLTRKKRYGSWSLLLHILLSLPNDYILVTKFRELLIIILYPVFIVI